MYKDTITIYNRYNGIWRGVVLDGVDINADRAAIVAKYGSDSKDNVRLHIKCAGDALAKYVEPNAYSGAQDTFTLSSGNCFTFFTEGAQSVLEGVDADYTDGFYDYMNATVGKCYAVTSVARYSVIPHWEIMGR